MKKELARMREDFRRQGKTADHLSDDELMEGVLREGRKLPQPNDYPGELGFYEAVRRFRESLPDA
jgi:hypothetical protein